MGGFDGYNYNNALDASDSFFSPFNKDELELLASNHKQFYKYSEGDKIIEEGQ
jgi:hypothetical protein